MMRAQSSIPEPVDGTTWLPNIVVDDPTLSVYDHAVYAHIAAADQTWGVCDHGVALLAHDAGCTVHRVRTALATLEQRGLITRTNEGARPGWHAPLDVVNRATVAANGAVLVPVGKEEQGYGR